MTETLVRQNPIVYRETGLPTDYYTAFIRRLQEQLTAAETRITDLEARVTALETP